MYFGICFTKRQFDCRELKAYGGKIMTNVSIYKDIAARTGGDIYIGSGETQAIRRINLPL